MSSRLGNKLRRIERAAGGRRFTREQLASIAAKSAFDTIAVLDRYDGAAFEPEQRARMRCAIDRVIRADIALASGNAAGLAPAYREELAAWRERDHRMALNIVMQALASEGLADWDSANQNWVGPGEGDPTGESEFVIERRWQRAVETFREWFSGENVLEGIDRMLSKAKAAHELTEQKRRESESDSKWADLARRLEEIRATLESDDDD